MRRYLLITIASLSLYPSIARADGAVMYWERTGVNAYLGVTVSELFRRYTETYEGEYVSTTYGDEGNRRQLERMCQSIGELRAPMTNGWLVGWASQISREQNVSEDAALDYTLAAYKILRNGCSALVVSE